MRSPTWVTFTYSPCGGHGMARPSAASTVLAYGRPLGAAPRRGLQLHLQRYPGRQGKLGSY